MPDNKGERDEGTYKRKLHRLLADLRPALIDWHTLHTQGYVSATWYDIDAMMGGTSSWKNVVFFLETYLDDLNDESATS